ncbi:LytR C-terminal domain-containing protein [Pedococcus sp. KACC 23699]|uniref:LytR C-terminal domain-containing protein n=1 Tax=Pedococcus sp. KACC 23699 TaxID=3149228 RepID=A0AAU7JZA6_9MICO
MSYIVESGASSSRRRRRRRALVTLGLAVLMLFFAFWYAYSYYEASDHTRAVPRPTCTPTAGPLLPAQVTLNVYNATDRAGLAAKTATEIRKRGFRVATVTNDPLQRKVAGAAEVRFGPSGAKASKLALGLVKGSKAVKDSRTDSSVDLVLGVKFTKLAAAPKATPKPTATQPGGC